MRERFRDEVAERVAHGVAASSNERVRLMWIGAGLWHDPGFYSALEDRHGAVFVWSMYMPFAGPQYIRELKDRPLHALASRVCSMNEVLHLPPWMNELDGQRGEALWHRCRGDPRATRQPAVAVWNAAHAAALEDAGVPVLRLSADMVDAKEWNHERMVEHVAEFLRTKGFDEGRAPRAAGRGAGACAACSRNRAGVTVLIYASPYSPAHPFSRADLSG